MTILWSISMLLCVKTLITKKISWVILCQILCTLTAVVECELLSCLEAFCVYLLLKTIWSDLEIELQNDHAAGFQTSHCFLWCQERVFIIFKKVWFSTSYFLQLRKLFPFHMIKNYLSFTKKNPSIVNAWNQFWQLFVFCFSLYFLIKACPVYGGYYGNIFKDICVTTAR